MLPRIIAHAKISFRHLHAEARAEAVQETVANSFVAFVRLVKLGKSSIAYAAPLAKYAVAQVRDGRQVGTSANCRDVSSPYGRKLKGIHLERLDHFDDTEGCWSEVLVEDKSCTPAELAASRIDFPAWLDTLGRRKRKIALKLSEGERTSAVAKRFHTSAGRISQIRRELAESWRRFVGDAGPDTDRPAAAA
jgi:hypothetical protein